MKFHPYFLNREGGRVIKLEYYQDVDVLYIRLSNSSVADTRDIADLALGDFDAEERLVSMTLSKASHYVDLAALPQQILERVEGTSVPVETTTGRMKRAG